MMSVAWHPQPCEGHWWEGHCAGGRRSDRGCKPGLGGQHPTQQIKAIDQSIICNGYVRQQFCVEGLGEVNLTSSKVQPGQTKACLPTTRIAASRKDYRGGRQGQLQQGQLPCVGGQTNRRNLAAVKLGLQLKIDAQLPGQLITQLLRGGFGLSHGANRAWIRS